MNSVPGGVSPAIVAPALAYLFRFPTISSKIDSLEANVIRQLSLFPLHKSSRLHARRIERFRMRQNMTANLIWMTTTVSARERTMGRTRR